MKVDPPFSPVLIAGLALPRFARPVLDRAAQSFATRVWSRHKKSFERMSDFAGRRFLLDPSDLPFFLVLEMKTEGPVLNAVIAEDTAGDIAATIRGSLRALVDLAEGRVDGDTLFFNRDLMIEGDTEAVLALRNSIEDADINLLQELAQLFGPFSKPAFTIATEASVLFERMSQDAHTLQAAMLAPLKRREAALEADARNLKERIVVLETQIKRQASRLKSMARQEASVANGVSGG